ncbi:MAG: tetratricopeptide repeat protein, partial [Verrucomicrobia bacterium]|nr:tetratricopeptide repeat protein [Verrucomicrobiota bacterium]
MSPQMVNRVAVAILVAAGLAAYAGSFSGPFVLDDPSSITANPTIRRLWPPWDVLATPRANVTVQGRPVLNLSFALNHAVSGYEVWSYHALNLAIHLLAGLALFGLVRRTLAVSAACAWIGGAAGPAAVLPEGRGRTASALGLAVALLWTVHPLQTESVTYVVQRAESLMGLFYLLTLYCFVRYAEGGAAARPSGWHAGAVLAGLAGMATKEVMVTAPVMIVLYDRTFFAGSFRAAWLQRRAFHLSLAATWLLLLVCLQRGGGNRGGAIGLGSGVAWWDYGLTQFEAIGRYVLLSFWPHPLVFEYGAFAVKRAADVLPWAALVVPLAAGTLRALWRRPAAGFAGAWFFGILAPTSLVPGTSQMIVEHRVYLPLAGLLALSVCGGYALAVRWGGARPAPGRVAALALLLASALGALTASRNATYRTALGLWTETVALRPHNPLAHHLLAEELARVGRHEEALVHRQRAARLDPGFALAQERLGELLLRLGRPAEAETPLRAALRLRPDFADAHNTLGALLAGKGRVDEAKAHVEKALALQPDFAEAHYNLANLLAQQGLAA